MAARGSRRLRTGGVAELHGVEYSPFVLMFEGLWLGAFGRSGGSVNFQNGYYNI